jgi:hypothetical protein
MKLVAGESKQELCHRRAAKSVERPSAIGNAGINVVHYVEEPSLLT